LANTYPEKKEFSKNYDSLAEQVENSKDSKEVKEEKLTAIENEKMAETFAYTISGRVGQFLEPVFKPLGFDWKITTASIGALAAKEVFVAQMGILYSEGEADEESETLRSRLAKNYTPLQGFCIMLFSLMSIPCLATLAIMKRELNSWKQTIFVAFGLFALAYIFTLITYQIGTLLDIGTKIIG
jgi:ferrous iron transport protein B